jgi:hypothetical protein
MMHTTDKLAELIRRKYQVLVQLREAAARQAEYIGCGDIGSLLTLLAVKQQLISALQALEQDLKPFYADDPDQRVWQSSQLRASCADTAAQCSALLEEIVEREKQAAEQMAVRRDEVARQLQQAHSARQVRSAYEAHKLAGS